jgi:hypothetical protein
LVTYYGKIHSLAKYIIKISSLGHMQHIKVVILFDFVNSNTSKSAFDTWAAVLPSISDFLKF